MRSDLTPGHILSPDRIPALPDQDPREAKVAGQQLRSVLPSHMEIQVTSTSDIHWLGKGAFRQVVSATLQLGNGTSYRAALKLIPYVVNGAHRDSISNEVALAHLLGPHTDVVSCHSWMVLGDNSNSLPLGSLEANLKQPLYEDEVVAVLELCRVMDTDPWTLVTTTLRRFPRAGLPLTVVSCLDDSQR